MICQTCGKPIEDEQRKGPPRKHHTWCYNHINYRRVGWAYQKKRKSPVYVKERQVRHGVAAVKVDCVCPMCGAYFTHHDAIPRRSGKRTLKFCGNCAPIAMDDYSNGHGIRIRHDEDYDELPF
jgi:hypothetical protein